MDVGQRCVRSSSHLIPGDWLTRDSPLPALPLIHLGKKYHFVAGLHFLWHIHNSTKDIKHVSTANRLWRHLTTKRPALPRYASLPSLKGYCDARFE